MTFRIEEKLFLNTNQIHDFKKWINLKNSKKIYNNRLVRSIYFENNIDQMFADSEEGCIPRKKIRVRNYPNNQNKFLYLEMKISSIEGRYKTSKIINEDTYKQLINTGIYDRQYGVCQPLIYVTYKREYYKINDVRISIDENINYSLFSGRKIGTDDNLIIELKTSFNKDRDDLINNFPFQRTRFSKYCNGFEKI